MNSVKAQIYRANGLSVSDVPFVGDVRPSLTCFIDDLFSFREGFRGLYRLISSAKIPLIPWKSSMPTLHTLKDDSECKLLKTITYI